LPSNYKVIKPLNPYNFSEDSSISKLKSSNINNNDNSNNTSAYNNNDFEEKEKNYDIMPFMRPSPYQNNSNNEMNYCSNKD